MQYIQCTRCGHLNTVKSVNILFCEQCNKRLPDNFIDWHKTHPDKNFDDFSRIYCISEYDIAARSQTEIKKTKPSVIAIFSVILFLLLGLGAYFGYRKFVIRIPANTEIGANWIRSNIGKSGMILDLPFELIKQPVELKNKTDIECFSRNYGNGFKILTYYTVYSDEPPNADTIIISKITEIQKTAGVRNLRWNRSDTLISNKNGIFLSFQYSLAEYRIKLNTIIVSEKNYVWQVMTQYSEDDEEGRQISDRILASIEIQ